MKGLIEGRIVHFVYAKGEHIPAMVLTVEDDEDGTCILRGFMNPFNDREYTAKYDPNFEVSTWHWIEGSQQKPHDREDQY